VGRGWGTTLENGYAFVSGGVEGGAVARIKLEGNPFVDGLVVKIDSLLDLALLPVGPLEHLSLDGPTKVIIVWYLGQFEKNTTPLLDTSGS
jgi:hypothetical protein